MDKLQILLKGLHDVWKESPICGENIFQLLNVAASKIKVDDYVGFKETSAFAELINSGKVNVFHYGVLVYDNHSLSKYSTLIPFKYAYSKKNQDPLFGLNSSLGRSESNVRDFLYGNKRNAEKVGNLGYSGYLLFSHNLSSKAPNWDVKTNMGENIELEDVEKLWGIEMGVLNIFKRDIFNYNGVIDGVVYTAMKIIDFDIEGSSSSYLMINSDNKEIIKRFIIEAECQKRILLLVSAVRSLYTQIHSDYQRKESIKSAKAAIMSRNLSHNLGSHVMSYLKESLNSVSDIEKTGALSEVYAKGKEIEIEEKDESGNIIKRKPELPFLVGTGRFISYLQERQDYIATVSTDYIPYQSVVNFKDSIYDELNPDYRFQRHKEWKGHKPTNILLENIAKSDGLSRKAETQDHNNIFIYFRSFDGLHGEGNVDYNELRKYNFSLPGGIMGRQAVFSIVENVIRNAAKHGSRKNGDNLTITFDIIDPNDSDKLDKIVDKNAKSRYTRSDDLYIIALRASGALSDDEKENAETLRVIIKAIREKLFYDEGTLQESNKGIKEMLISAAWLRNIKIEELDDRKKKEIAPILRVGQYNGQLQYLFCVPKVKEIALITDSEVDVDRSLWSKYGWYVYTKEDYLKLRSKDFGFVILDDLLTPDEKTIRRCSNNRFFVASNYTDIEQRRIKTDVIKRIGDLKEEDLDVEKKKLYEQLADEEEFKIAISDSIERESLSSHVENVQKLVMMEDDLGRFKYIYRQHNDRKMEFNEFEKSFGANGGDWDNLCFVEGITGGNSTDRLVRHCVLDDLWAYQHVHAMKTRVAIFDERIFARITGVSPSDYEVKTKQWEEEFADLDDQQSRNFFEEYDKNRRRIIIRDMKIRNGYDTYSKDEILKLAYYFYSWDDEFEITSIMPLVYNKKGIDVYTMTEDGDGMLIWGVTFTVGSDMLHYGSVKQIGRLEWDEEKNPVLLFFGALKRKYEYLSIHQGLLDKVYKKIPYTGKPLISNYKKRAAKKIFDEFMALRCDEEDYLQGLIIHSGRSKPNLEDMPQHQPFVQYSALENAVYDCKMTLVELLDHACFE